MFEPLSVQFDKPQKAAFEAKWDKFNKTFTKQINWRFQRVLLSREERDDQLGRGLRSSVEEDLLIDDDGAMANTTNIKRTSRYHIEDILRMREKDKIVVYFKYNKTWLKNNYSNIPLDAGEQQRGIEEPGLQ